MSFLCIFLHTSCWLKHMSEKKYTRSQNRKKNRKSLKMNKFRVGCPREKKLYDLSKRCIIKSINTERVKDNFWNSYAVNFYGVSSQTQTIIMVQKPLKTKLLHWISEWTKLVAINFKDCTDLLLWEKIVQTISKCLQILVLKPRISKVFLNH